MADLDLRGTELLGDFNRWARPWREHAYKHGRPAERMLLLPGQKAEYDALCAKHGYSPSRTGQYKGTPIVVVEDP